MKLITTYVKPLVGNQRLFPRDIRNYLASICSKDKELHEFVMWHQRKFPELIYTMPNRKGFCVITYKDDIKTTLLMDRLKNSIQQNTSLQFKNQNIDTSIKEVYVADFKYTKFKGGLFQRNLRTPMVIAASKQDYAKARELSEGGKVDMDKLQKLTIDAIKQGIIGTNKDWYGKEVADDMDDLMILFKDLEYTPIKYKENEYYPAVRGDIICNKKLPEFIGYKIGLGYGELMREKEMERYINAKS